MKSLMWEELSEEINQKAGHENHAEDTQDEEGAGGHPLSPFEDLLTLQKVCGLYTIYYMRTKYIYIYIVG